MVGSGHGKFHRSFVHGFLIPSYESERLFCLAGKALLMFCRRKSVANVLAIIGHNLVPGDFSLAWERG